MTDKEIVLKTLEHINHKGFVDIKPLWMELNIDEPRQIRIKEGLTLDNFVRLAYGQPFAFEITDPLGVSIIKKPKRLNKDGRLIIKKSERFKKWCSKNWMLVAVFVWFLGLFNSDIRSAILSAYLKYMKPQETGQKESPASIHLESDTTVSK